MGQRPHRIPSIWAWLGPLLALPAACWTRAQERRIEREGEPLPEFAHAAARALGLDPDTLSVLRLPQIPQPGDWLGLLFYPRRHRLTIHGMTLGNGIYLRADCAADLSLLCHELVHVAQYRRLGGHRAFLARYLAECLSVGYFQAPLEQEARAFPEQFLAKSSPHSLRSQEMA